MCRTRTPLCWNSRATVQLSTHYRWWLLVPVRPTIHWSPLSLVLHLQYANTVTGSSHQPNFIRLCTDKKVNIKNIITFVIKLQSKLKCIVCLLPKQVSPTVLSGEHVFLVESEVEVFLVAAEFIEFIRKLISWWITSDNLPGVHAHRPTVFNIHESSILDGYEIYF